MLTYWYTKPLGGLGSLAFLFLLFRISLAAQVNRTIDDTKGDSVTGVVPTYVPSTGGVWAGAGCTGCAIQPDPTQAFDGTWTAATYNAQLGLTYIEFSFTGTAIYVFFILPNYIAPGITTQTECNFTLDGQAPTSFSHIPSTSTQIIYNALVFSSSNLQNTNHNLNISTSGVNHDVFINFDYAIYTAEDTTTTPVSPVASLNPGPSSSPSSVTSTPTTSSSTIPANLPTPSSNSSSITTGVAPNGSSQPPVSNNSTGAGSATSLSQPTGASVVTTAHRNSTTILPAAVGGSVGAVAILLVVVFLLCRRHKRNSKDAQLAPRLLVPFDGAPPANHPTSEFFPNPVTGITYSESSGGGNQAGLLDPSYNNQTATSSFPAPAVLDRKQHGRSQERLPQSRQQPLRDFQEPPPEYAV